MKKLKVNKIITILLSTTLLFLPKKNLLPDEFVEETLICPVDSKEFKIYRHKNWEKLLDVGQDYDLYSRKQTDIQRFELIIYTCPSCFYSGYKKDFDKGVQLSEDFKKKIITEKVLKPEIELKENSSQKEIAGWVKYILAAECWKLRGKDKESPYKFACIYIYAIWSVRDWGAVFLDDTKFKDLFYEKGLHKTQLAIGSKMKPDYDFSCVESLKKTISKNTGKEMFYEKYLVAYAYRLHGEFEIPEKFCGELKKEDNLPESIKNATDRMLKSIELEKRFIKSAIENILISIEKKDIEEKDIPLVEYFLAEYNRRLQNYEEAKKYYEKSIADSKKYNTKIHKKIKEFAEKQKKIVEKK